MCAFSIQCSQQQRIDTCTTTARDVNHTILVAGQELSWQHKGQRNWCSASVTHPEPLVTHPEPSVTYPEPKVDQETDQNLKTHSSTTQMSSMPVCLATSGSFEHDCYSLCREKTSWHTVPREDDVISTLKNGSHFCT